LDISASMPSGEQGRKENTHGLANSSVLTITFASSLFLFGLHIIPLLLLVLLLSCLMKERVGI
jgi:hypothetical protein